MEVEIGTRVALFVEGVEYFPDDIDTQLEATDNACIDYRRMGLELQWTDCVFVQDNQKDLLDTVVVVQKTDILVRNISNNNDVYYWEVINE